MSLLRYHVLNAWILLTSKRKQDTGTPLELLMCIASIAIAILARYQLSGQWTAPLLP